MNSTLKKLIGNWESTSAFGSFPNIKDFDYQETLFFEENGQPLLHYCLISKMGAETKHCEEGFLRMLQPQSNLVCSIEAHNFGVTVIYEGEISDDDTITLESKSISRISTAKEPHVTHLKKVFKFINEDELEMRVEMATSNKPLNIHLLVSYKRKIE